MSRKAKAVSCTRHTDTTSVQFQREIKEFNESAARLEDAFATVVVTLGGSCDFCPTPEATVLEPKRESSRPARGR